MSRTFSFVRSFIRSFVRFSEFGPRPRAFPSLALLSTKEWLLLETVKVYTGVIDDLMSSRGKIRNLSDCATIQIYYVTHLGMYSNHKHAIYLLLSFFFFFLFYVLSACSPLESIVPPLSPEGHNPYNYGQRLISARRYLFRTIGGFIGINIL